MLECACDLGLESKWDNGSNAKVDEFMMWCGAGGKFTLAHQLIHKKYGFTIEMHHCVRLDDWAFKLIGPWPQTKSAIARLEAFIKYARRRHETRGRKSKTKEAKRAEAVLFKSQVVAAIVAILEIPETVTQKSVARKLWPTRRKDGDRMLREKLKYYGLEWDDLRRKAEDKNAG